MLQAPLVRNNESCSSEYRLNYPPQFDVLPTKYILIPGDFLHIQKYFVRPRSSAGAKSSDRFEEWVTDSLTRSLFLSPNIYTIYF